MSATEQLALPAIEVGWELVTLEDDRRSGRFTAALLEQNTGKRDAIVEALAQGMSIRAIAKAYSVSTNTVLAVKRIHGEKIETEKERLGRDCFDVARMAVERMRDEIELMPRAALPIVAGIMIERGALLTGAPTARIAHDGPTIGSVKDYIESLPCVSPPVRGQERIAQKGPVLELGQAAETPAVDTASTVLPTLPEATIGNGQESGPIAPKKATP